MKRLLMIAAAVAVLGLATVAIGGAITSAQEGDGPIGTLLAKVADKLGVSEEELQTAFDEVRDETIDEKVAEGLLTEEQAERLRERAAEGGLLFPRPSGEGRFHPRQGACQRGTGLVIEAAAQVLDMPKEELVEELKDGNSLAKVAEAQGMSVEEFEAALLEQVNVQLDEMVADGTITQEQADRILQGIEDRIDRVVHAQPKTLGPCPPRHGPGGFDGSRDGLFNSESDTAESSDVTA
jgi:polyhydroxyalkanoate synthesis regulator phasin